MQEAIWSAGPAKRLVLVLVAVVALTPGLAASSQSPGAAALHQVAYHDGSSWRAVELTTGSIEGPGGGLTPTARLKSELGGPKTYFLLAGPVSELAISIPRPRFRFAADEGTARRVQLAQFETRELLRRTTVQFGNGIAVFQRGSELEVSKVVDGVWEARPKKSLQPGEYALVLNDASPVADFTIVESGY